MILVDDFDMKPKNIEKLKKLISSNDGPIICMTPNIQGLFLKEFPNVKSVPIGNWVNWEEQNELGKLNFSVSKQVAEILNSIYPDFDLGLSLELDLKVLIDHISFACLNAFHLLKEFPSGFYLGSQQRETSLRPSGSKSIWFDVLKNNPNLDFTLIETPTGDAHSHNKAIHFAFDLLRRNKAYLKRAPQYGLPIARFASKKNRSIIFAVETWDVEALISNLASKSTSPVILLDPGHLSSPSPLYTSNLNSLKDIFLSKKDGFSQISFGSLKPRIRKIKAILEKIFLEKQWGKDFISTFMNLLESHLESEVKTQIRTFKEYKSLFLRTRAKTIVLNSVITATPRTILQAARRSHCETVVMQHGGAGFIANPWQLFRFADAALPDRYFCYGKKVVSANKEFQLSHSSTRMIHTGSLRFERIQKRLKKNPNENSKIQKVFFVLNHLHLLQFGPHWVLPPTLYSKNWIKLLKALPKIDGVEFVVKGSFKDKIYNPVKIFIENESRNDLTYIDHTQFSEHLNEPSLFVIDNPITTLMEISLTHTPAIWLDWRNFSWEPAHVKSIETVAHHLKFSAFDELRSEDLDQIFNAIRLGLAQKIKNQGPASQFFDEWVKSPVGGALQTLLEALGNKKNKSEEFASIEKEYL